MRLIHQTDTAIIKRLGKLPPGVEAFMYLVTNAGSGLVVGTLAAATLLLLFIAGSDYLRPAVAVVALLPLAEVVKLLTRRVRRDTVYVRNTRRQTFSFPSGHAYASFLLYGFLAYLAADWPAYILFGGLIGLVGTSRVYLGAHFPTDVLGGWLLAGLVLSLIIWYGQPVL